jgi:acyl carrier protein
MDPNDERLVRCFNAVFPRLDERQIRAARTDSIPGWDSVTMVMLLNVVSEEFGIEVDWDHIDELNSFSDVARMVRDRAA